MEHDDVFQMLHQLGVEFNVVKSNIDISIFEVPKFGLKVVWAATKYEEDNDDWNVVIIYPIHDQREVRENIIWSLAKGGFFHYLRNTYPNTFSQMLAGRSGEDWHKKILTKRLEKFGDKPKYNYFAELNHAYMDESSMSIISIDQGFYDFVI